MHFITLFSHFLLLSMTYSTFSHPLSVSSKIADLPPSQIDHFCSYIFQYERSMDVPTETSLSQSPHKRFAIPFPDMNRFLSTSHKLHHHDSNMKISTELGSKKTDFHAYLCSIAKDSEEMSNFISIFIEEHGQEPAFNLFESCEQVVKRDQPEITEDKPSIIQLKELKEFCYNRPETRFAKRWKHSVGGPMSIDFIHQMLESRKVKSYPYRAEMDPYLVGR